MKTTPIPPLQEVEAGRESRHTSIRDVHSIKREYDNKKIATRKINSNKLHVKLGHPREFVMHATAQHIQYIIKGTIYVYNDCATENSGRLSSSTVSSTI